MPNFVAIAQNAAEIWRFFNYSRWRPSAILDFQKLEISTSGRSHLEAQYASSYQIWRRSVKPLRTYGRFSIFQDGGGRHLGFWKIKFLTVGTIERGELRQHAKFWRNRSKRAWNIAIFQFFKMAAVRHLEFSKVGNFNFRSHLEAQYASACQISQKSVEPFRRYD